MRLKAIRLAGFKSFVEPTVIPLETTMTAIVGPNGCGKSNVIDAVRWVMGESSAKSLRGESLSDVIFNGTTQRPPLGQASIELHFNNHDALMGGRYAAYNELVIRRELKREGTSHYYLNGARCRRRDIIEIFLGTGLGPRSYAIIEQFMVSRLIDAKPEDLRIFFEEAAGVSRYREKRHETELRIRHTEENLQRVADLKAELERHKRHIERQAGAAVRYEGLKRSERTQECQLLALRHARLSQACEEREETLEALREEIQQLSSERHSLGAAREAHEHRCASLRAEQQRLDEAYHAEKERVAVLERECTHLKSRWQQYAQDRTLLDAEHVQIKASEQSLRQQAQSLAEALEEAQRDLHAQQEVLAQVSGLESEAALEMQQLEQRWNRLQSQLRVAEREEADASANLRQLTGRLEALEAKRAKHELQADSFHLDQEEAHYNEAVQLLEEHQGVALQAEEGHASAEAFFREAQRQWEQAKTDHEEIFRQTVRLRTELQSLQEVHHALVNAEILESEAQAWIERHGLSHAPRLFESLVVDPHWMHALESLLASRWSGLWLSGDFPSSPDLPQKSFYAARPSEPFKGRAQIGLSTLASHLSVGADAPFLYGVYCAASYEEARAHAALLEPWESIMTPEGILVGRDWCSSGASERPESHGILERVASMRRLEADLPLYEAREAAALDALHRTQQGLRERESELEHARSVCMDTERARVTLEASVQMAKRQRDAEQQRWALWRNEGQLLDEEWHELQTQRQAWETQHQGALHRVQEHQDFCGEVAVQKHAQEEQLRLLRDRLKQCAFSEREARTALEVLKARDQGVKQEKDRLEETWSHLERRAQQLSEVMGGLSSSEDLESQWAQAIERCKELEMGRQAHTNLLQAEEAAYLEQVHQLNEREKQIEHARERLHDVHLMLSSDGARLESLKEEALEKTFSENDFKSALEHDPLPTEEQCLADLEKIRAKLAAIGPVNHAAASEMDEVVHRLSKLQEEEADVRAALETLCRAMEAMDQESRDRFEAVFESVNGIFQELFPKLFGGGSASLEWRASGEGGVVIRAQPPGKRNSTIHLLSGGEKALTAIALIFSFFKMNPSPFCILDEVDAPLDEHNVLRYAQLVREMSGQTQFILITHNKSTMELADRLLGVTMQEPGVSRLVGVDLQAAVDMAQAG